MSILSQKLNFTWTIDYPAIGEYGLVQSDGSEDGLIGELSTIYVFDDIF